MSADSPSGEQPAEEGASAPAAPWPGFGVVPLCDAVQRQPRAAARFGRALPGHIFGTFTVIYRVDLPVHARSAPRVPAGLLAPPGAAPSLRVDASDPKALGPVRPLPRGLAGAVLPGHALRAAARARYAAATRSCAPPPPGFTAGAGPYAGWQVRPTPTALAHPAFVPCALHDAAGAVSARPALCPACGLFGLPGLRGRLWFEDLTTATPPTRAHLPSLDPPAPSLGAAVWPDAERAVLWVDRWPGRLFAEGPPPGPGTPGETVETLPVGAELEAGVGVDGLAPAELGGLLSALGLAPGSRVRVGEGLGHGFGRLRPVNVRWSLRDAEGAALAPAVKTWRAAFAGGADYWRDGEVALVMLHTRGEP